MSLMNRLHNAGNKFQGASKRVLCVCSAGLLRSPTAAKVLGNPPFNFNTRSAGSEDDFALIRVDTVLLQWADEIVCMTSEQETSLRRKFKEEISKMGNSAPLFVTLHIEDNYEYDDPDLKKKIQEKYLEVTGMLLDS